MKKVFLILFTIILCDNEISLSPEVSICYYGIKENHIYSYGSFSYINQFTESNLIYGDAILLNNIISRKFDSILLGDINQDTIINIQDIILIINLVINEESNNLADINTDGVIDILDIVLVINIILNN